MSGNRGLHATCTERRSSEVSRTVTCRLPHANVAKCEKGSNLAAPSAHSTMPTGATSERWHGARLEQVLTRPCALVPCNVRGGVAVHHAVCSSLGDCARWCASLLQGTTKPSCDPWPGKDVSMDDGRHIWTLNKRGVQLWLFRQMCEQGV